MKNLLLLLAIAMAVVPFVAAESQNLSDEQRIQQLEQLLVEQGQRITELQSRLDNTRANDYFTAPAIAEEAGITAGYDKGFFVRSADGAMQLKFSGYAQMGVALFESKTDDSNGVFPNSAFLTWDVNIGEAWHVRFQIDVAGAPGGNYGSVGGAWGIGVRDAYAEYTMSPEFHFRIGNTYVPHGIEGQYGANQGLGIAKATYGAWFPGRNPGLEFYGTLAEGLVGYKLGFYNGDGSAAGNADDDFMIAGQTRIYFMGEKENPNAFFHLSVLRRHTDAVAGNVTPTLRTTWGRGGLFGGAGAGAFTNGSTSSVDVGIKFQQKLDELSVLRVEGEWNYTLWEREAGAARNTYLRGFAGFFGFSYKYNLTPEVDGAGLIVPIFRVGFADIDEKTSDPGAMPGQLAYDYTLGFGYAFNNNVTLQFNWTAVQVNYTKANAAYTMPKETGTKRDSFEQAFLFQLTANF